MVMRILAFESSCDETAAAVVEYERGRFSVLSNIVASQIAVHAKFGGVRDANAKYTLTVTLKDPVTKYKALESTGDATWQEIMLTANYKLYSGGKQIASGSESASESYTFVRYLVAANASYNNAVQNTIQVLVDKIGARVITETYRYEQKNQNKDVADK